MKIELEKLLLYLIPAIVLQKIIAALVSHFLTGLSLGGDNGVIAVFAMFPNITPADLLTIIKTSTEALNLLPFIVIAIWVWRIESIYKGRPVLWALGALFINYWLLALYIGHRIYDKNSGKEKA
jgi:hypothetical protein